MIADASVQDASVEDTRDAALGDSSDGGPDSGNADAHAGADSDAFGEADSDGATDTTAGACSADGGASGRYSGPGGVLSWAGAESFPGAWAVAIDPSTGDFAVVGYFGPVADFGGGPVLAACNTPGIDGGVECADTFVARYDSQGAYKWARALGLSVDNLALTVDASGNVAVSGEAQGTLTLGGGTFAANGAFLVELDAAGNYRWSRDLSGPALGPHAVAVDPSGNVVLVGLTYVPSTGGGPATGYHTLTKLDSSGALLWTKLILASDPFGDYHPALAVDGAGDVIVAGTFVGTADFGRGAVTASDDLGEAFVAKYDPSGQYLWAREYPAVSGGSAAPDSSIVAGQLAVDGCGNIFVDGSFASEGEITGDTTIDLGSGVLTRSAYLGDASTPFGIFGAAAKNAFLAKIDPSGQGVWSKSFFSTGIPARSWVDLVGLTVDGEGGPKVSSIFCGSVNFGGGVFTTGDDDDCYGDTFAVAGFDADGHYRWGLSFGGGAIDFAANSASVVLVGNLQTCPAADSGAPLSGGTCAASPPGSAFIAPRDSLTLAGVTP